MGDSGEELGDGSVREDESTVDIVVVGDESVESEACVDVLSLCWCCVFILWFRACALSLAAAYVPRVPST